MDVHQKLQDCRQLIRKHWKVLRVALVIACIVFLAKALLSWRRIVNLADRITLVVFALLLASVLCGWAANKVYRLAHPTRGGMPPIRWWWMVLALVAVVVVVWASTEWLIDQMHGLSETDLAKQRIEALRTGLAAGVGLGAAFTVLLALRRQQHHEDATRKTEDDATERRITELYTKAVEQIGSERAAVRLGGIYSLQRLAQGNKDHRQTIVDVLCAYLRMSSNVPGATHPAAADQADNTESQSDQGSLGPEPASTASEQEAREEREVRAAAQQVLTSHVRCTDTQADTAAQPETFWPGLRLNLNGAHLRLFDLRDCSVDSATFVGTHFHGKSDFTGMTCLQEISLKGAHFHGETLWDEATIHSTADFTHAVFRSDASFDETCLGSPPSDAPEQAPSPALFDDAKFIGQASFVRAVFTGVARFEKARFKGRASFSGAEFRASAYFSKASFDEEAMFLTLSWSRGGRSGTQNVIFRSNTSFSEATFGGAAHFGSVEFRDGVDLHAHVMNFRAEEGRYSWPQGYRIAPGTGPTREVVSGELA
ncbi:pentapeptide repeat-containing protein [Streptomyces sp. NBC_00868]|uniref:pentapeptide repeat-containing protein n=1 Tax=unclassified Streptomyces TaxID=2593676 RepID=UPI00324CA544|nr:pentapeptide repeat-containing protein [Streptomyces sp. NBC_00868]